MSAKILCWKRVVITSVYLNKYTGNEIWDLVAGGQTLSPLVQLGGHYTTLLEIIRPYLFCKNLVVFNKARLPEASLNIHTHAWFFPACQ